MIKTLTIALLLAVGTAAATGPQPGRYTIDVRDADLGDVVALIAAQSNRNIVVDGTVKSTRVTLHLHDVTFDQAFGALLRAYDLEAHSENGVLLVGTSSSMNRRYGDAAEHTAAHTVVIPLRHARADDVARTLAEALSSAAVVIADKRTGSLVISGDEATIRRAKTLTGALDRSTYGAEGTFAARAIALKFVRASEIAAQIKPFLPDGSFFADDRQNALVVTGNAEVRESAAAIVASLDVASPQVLFEVRVLDVQPENEQSNIGLQFGGIDLSGQPIPGAATYAFTRSAISVNARLNALVSSGHAQILATPKLMTLNNHESSLLIGQTYPVVFYDAKLGGQQVQFVDVGVKLRLTPTIGADGSVTAEMHPEYSAIQSFVGGYPVLANRRADSTLRVRDNETIVLGGLLRDIDSETVTKVPYLGDVPVFGQVFRNRTRSRERDEIVFLITPHVLVGNQTISH